MLYSLTKPAHKMLLSINVVIGDKVTMAGALVTIFSLLLFFMD